MALTAKFASPLTIRNSYVIRLVHDDKPAGWIMNFVKQKNEIRKAITEPWAYSDPALEERSASDWNAPIDMVSYWAFSNDADALQFLLTNGDSAKKIYMYPAGRTFTVYS